MKRCSICRKAFKGYGHNPEPVKRWMDGSCCDSCNASVVLPARIASAKQEAADIDLLTELMERRGLRHA